MSEFESAASTYTRSVLEKMPEGDLRQAEHTVSRHINSLRAANKQSYELEVELCYIQDEMNRRAIAAAWVDSKRSS